MSRAKIGNKVENGTMNSDATMTIRRLLRTSSLRQENCHPLTMLRAKDSFPPPWLLRAAAARRPDLICVVQRVARRNSNPWAPYATPVLKTDISTPANAPSASRRVRFKVVLLAPQVYRRARRPATSVGARERLLPPPRDRTQQRAGVAEGVETGRENHIYMMI